MKHVAIIGAGQIAEKVHVSYYKQRSEVLKVVAVVDPFLERAREFAERNDIPQYYATIEEMLADVTIDIASICTPNRFHFESAMELLSAGVHVFCEKPPAMTAEEAKYMQLAAAEHHVLLAFDFQHRFSYETQRLKQELALLGDIYYVQAQALRRSGVPGWGNFIDKNLQGGGPLIDLGIHMLDTALFLLKFPKIKKVQAYSFQKIGPFKNQGTFGQWDPTKYTVEDSLFGTLEFENGGILRLDTSFALNIKEESIYNMRLCGDKAGANLYPLEIYSDDKGQLVTYFQEELSILDKHNASMAQFVQAVLTGETGDLATAEQGYQVQKIIELLYQSAQTGEVLYYEDY